MKLIFTQEELQKSISVVQKAVPTRTTLPILECILIDATRNEIRMTANDMELGIETSVTGEIVEKGSIALDARILSDVVRRLPNSQITITTDEKNFAEIVCEKAKFQIPGQPGEDFATLPPVDREEQITLSQYSLREMIRQTIFSTAMNENNQLMTGELFEVKDGALKVVALDGHRIAIRNLELKEADAERKAVVPGKTLSEVSKILSGETEDMVDITFTKNHILFEFDGTLVLSRLIDGEYFRIEQMLSSDYETKITVNKRELLDCLDRASLLIREHEKMPVILNIDDGGMNLQINASIGSLNEDISIEKTGKDLTIGFNPKYVSDALRAINDETVDLYFVNPKAPCFIRDEAGSYVYLILPVNIR